MVSIFYRFIFMRVILFVKKLLCKTLLLFFDFVQLFFLIVDCSTSNGSQEWTDLKVFHFFGYTLYMGYFIVSE